MADDRVIQIAVSLFFFKKKNFFGGGLEMERGVAAAGKCFPSHQFRSIVHQGDCKKAINLVRSSADASPPYGFMLLPGTTSSGLAMKLSSFSLSQNEVRALHSTGIAEVR